MPSQECGLGSREPSLGRESGSCWEAGQMSRVPLSVLWERAGASGALALRLEYLIHLHELGKGSAGVLPQRMAQGPGTFGAIQGEARC